MQKSASGYTQGTTGLISLANLLIGLLDDVMEAYIKSDQSKKTEAEKKRRDKRMTERIEHAKTQINLGANLRQAILMQTS